MLHAEIDQIGDAKPAQQLEPLALISPSNEIILQQLDVTLKWNQSNLAETYHLQIASDSMFANVLNDYSAVSTTEKYITGLSNNKSYYWRVSAVNSYGTSDWSQTGKFTISIPLPSKPQLVYPGDLANYLNTSLYVKWEKVSGVTNYKFELSNDSSFITTVIKDSTLTDTTRVISGLKEGKIYYWRISAKGIAGTGSWSDIRIFTTLLPAPSNLSLERTGLTEVKLNWKINSIEEDGLIVERKSSNGSAFSVIDTIKEKENCSWMDEKL